MIQERLVLLIDEIERQVGNFKPEFYARMREGLSFLEMQRPEIAEKSFFEAYKIEPESPRALEFIGHSRFLQGRLPDAIEAYGQHTYAEPSVGVYKNLAFALATFGKYHPYLALLRNALDHNLDDDMLIRIGRISVTQDMTDLTEKVQSVMKQRGLSVKLYPL